VASSHFSLTSSVTRNLRPFKADFIFGNSKKSFGAESGEQGGCSISEVDSCAKNCELEHCHVAESNLWAKAKAFFYA
jgi:hypothetical protein